MGGDGGEQELGRSVGGWGHTHTHTHTPEQVGSNGVREGNAHLTPRGGSSCARGRFASIRLPAPHGTIGATYPIVNGVRFIPVNPSPLLKVALPLRNAFPPVPTFLVKHP